jgi:hypothetical protein
MWRWSRPVVDRHDVDAVLAALFDIRRLLNQIRIILEEDDE